MVPRQKQTELSHDVLPPYGSDSSLRLGSLRLLVSGAKERLVAHRRAGVHLIEGAQRICVQHVAITYTPVTGSDVVERNPRLLFKRGVVGIAAGEEVSKQVEKLLLVECVEEFVRHERNA